MLNLSRRHFLATGVALTTPLPAAPADSVHPHLADAFPLDRLRSLLLPRSEWNPYPRAGAAAWQKVPAGARQALVRLGAAHLEGEWPLLPATYFLDYVRIGNRTKADNVRRTRRNMLRELALAEAIEHRGRFLDAIVNGIWLICEETYWGSPAHLGVQRAGAGLPDVEEPTVDLFSADTAAVLAWVDYLLADDLAAVSKLIRPRIWYEVNRRVLTPNEQRDDFSWMGFKPRPDGRAPNNWNPWINSNWLTANLLLEPDAGRRLRTVHRILRSLDVFLGGYYPDGGCDEGPGYWNRAGASLFDCLELLHSASRGRIDVYSHPLIGEIGRYIVRAHIYGPWFVNFADASAKVRPDGILVYRYGKRVQDRNMQLFGAWAAAESREGYSGHTKDFERELSSLFHLDEVAAAPKKQPLVRDVWLPGIQMMAARMAAGSPEGLYVAAHGGHNGESHNHNDVGDFIVYAGGQPAIIDIGVETYTAKTFSSRRYEIWTMQSVWHNLPTIDGRMQAPGVQAAARDLAYQADDHAAEFSLDIAGAWPASAGIRHWKRTVRLDRAANQLTVTDRRSLSNPPREITQTLMTPGPVRELDPGKLRLAGVTLTYDPGIFTPKTEKVDIKDARLRASWGNTLYRVLLIAAEPGAEGEWTLRISQPA